MVRAVVCRNSPAAPVKVPAGVEPIEFAAGVLPGAASAGLGDPDEQEGEPAEDDVGADAFFEPMVAGPQVDDLFHVPPASLDLQQLLVIERDVLGGQVRVGAAQQILAVEVLLGLDLGGVDTELACRSGAQIPVQAWLGGDLPAQLAPFEVAELDDELLVRCPADSGQSAT